MNLILGAILVVFVAFPLGAWAKPDLDDFRLIAYKVDSTQEPQNLVQGVDDALKNPIVGLMLRAGAAYLGVPQEAVTVAALAAQVIAGERKGEERNYRFVVPEAYLVCAANFSLNSINPPTGDRASFVAAGGTSSEVSIYTWTPTQNALDNRTSWVDMDVGILAVKKDKVEKYRGKCADPSKTQSYFSCRGSNCPFARGAWSQDAWVKVDDHDNIEEAVSVVMKLLILNN